MTHRWTSWFRGNARGYRLASRAARSTEQAIEKLSARIAELEETNRKLESTNRIQQVEIDELSAVVARNLERVKAETRVLGVSMPEIARPAGTQQEIESHD